jgi:hypothetical protein
VAKALLRTWENNPQHVAPFFLLSLRMQETNEPSYVDMASPDSKLKPVVTHHRAEVVGKKTH